MGEFLNARAVAIAKARELAKSPPLQLAAGALLLLGIGYYIVKKILGGAGGLLSGNNFLTEDTPYAGGGVVGTVAAATNTVLGGAPQAIGESNFVQDGLTALFNEGYDGYRYRGGLVLQVQRRSDGKIFNVDAQGNITGAA